MGMNNMNFLSDNIYKTLVTLLTICGVFLSNFACADNAQEDLLKRLNTLQSFESQYEQSVFDKNNKVIEESRGRFYLGNNKAFKNTIEYPEKSAMISDGKKLWQIDYELEQVSVSYLKNYLDNSPLSLLLGNAKQSLESFDIKKTENMALNQQLYQLTAKDTLASILAVRLGFKSSIITYIELDERSGNKVRINFSNNSELKNAKEAFKAIIPKGFDLVDET